MDVFKYAVECDSLYKVVAFFFACTLFEYITWFCYKSIIIVAKLIQYIANKITKYKEIHAKAQCNNTSFEVELHKRDDLGAE